MPNNFYNQTSPWTYSPTALNTLPNPNVQQSPGYSGFNNFQRPSIPSAIPGRLVNNLDEITPQEVPMDGSVSLFPQNDYSCIYAKTWTKEGTIATMKFVPEQPQTTTEQKSPLEERLDQIDKKLDALDKKLYRPRKHNNSYQRKEKNEDE